MGNSLSEPEDLRERKRHLSVVCNILPDVPTHTYVIWNNPETDPYSASETTSPILSDPLHVPIFLDLRYTMDIAPFIRYKDPRLFSMGMISVYVYNLLQTKFNMQWMCHAEHLMYLTVLSMYRCQTVSLPPEQEPTSLRERYLLPETCYYGIERVLSILRDQGVVEDKMELPIERMSPLFDCRYFYVPKEELVMKMALYQNHLILANLSLFSNIMDLTTDNRLPLPRKEDSCLGMITVIVVGYREEYWLIRFPFGHRWCENGYCYVPMEYFDRYNRDRWIIMIDRLKQMRIEKQDLSCEFTTSSISYNNHMTTTTTPAEKQQAQGHPPPIIQQQTISRKRMGF